MVFTGECDVRWERDLHRGLERVERKQDVIFDLSQVEFMDARCVGRLIAFQNRRRAAHLKSADLVVRPGTLLERLFHMANVEREFNIVRSLDELVEKNGSPIEVEYL